MEFLIENIFGSFKIKQLVLTLKQLNLVPKLFLSKIMIYFLNLVQKQLPNNLIVNASLMSWNKENGGIGIAPDDERSN